MFRKRYQCLCLPITAHHVAVAICLVSNGFATSVFATTYQFYDLGTLDRGHSAYAVAISENGYVAGTGVTATGETRAFRYREDENGGQLLNLGTIEEGSPHAWRSEAADVNDKGIVVGSSWIERSSDADGALVTTREAFAFGCLPNTECQSGNGNPSESLHALRQLPPAVPGSLGSYPFSDAYAINNHGMIVGQAVTGFSSREGVAFTKFHNPPDGHSHSLNVPDVEFTRTFTGSWNSRALTINDSYVVGGVHEPFAQAIRTQPFGDPHLRDGSLPEFKIGANHTYRDINENLYAVITNASGGHGGAYRIVTPDSFFVSADHGDTTAINNVGFAVGGFRGGRGHAGSHTAFVLDPFEGKLIDLNQVAVGADGYNLIKAYDINDKGWIVGVALNSDGDERPFLLKPEKQSNTLFNGGFDDVITPHFYREDNLFPARLGWKPHTPWNFAYANVSDDGDDWAAMLFPAASWLHDGGVVNQPQRASLSQYVDLSEFETTLSLDVRVDEICNGGSCQPLEVNLTKADGTTVSIGRVELNGSLDGKFESFEFTITGAHNLLGEEDVLLEIGWTNTRSYEIGRTIYSLDSPLEERVYRGVLIDNISLVETGATDIQGDFDGDDSLSVFDVDALTDVIASEANESKFDLNQDGTVDSADHTKWVKELAGTWFGDANLDGEFNSGDLIGVFQAGKYETEQVASWSEGDWNGDRLVNTADLITAFQDGGYEKGPSAVASVPEPTCGFGLLIACVSTCTTIGRRKRP